MVDRPIKVLMLVPNLRVSNGVTSYAMNYFRNLNHKNIKMDFAVYRKRENPYEEEINAAGSNIFLLPSVKKEFPAHIKACLDLIKNGQYDVIHDNSMLITYPMMKIAKKYVPVRILHSHNSKLGETIKKEKRNKRFLPFLLHQANAYAACSDLAAKAMFGDKEYEFIPNFVDTEKYRYDENIRRRVRHDMNADQKTIIVTVGRVAPQKNPFFALDVIDLLIEKDPDVEYWWIGSGPQDKEVCEYAHKLHHANQIRFLGSRDNVHDLYLAADIFFLPSLFEGLPITGVESQAMGLPSVISDTVTKEMVYTDLVEYVPLGASIEQWIEVFEKQMKRIPERRPYTKELENSAFSSKHSGEKLESYYRRLLSESRR